jgi:hypothetical protein
MGNPLLATMHGPWVDDVDLCVHGQSADKRELGTV